MKIVKDKRYSIKTLKMMICTFYDPLLAIKHQAIWLLVNISYGTIVIHPPRLPPIPADIQNSEPPLSLIPPPNLHMNSCPQKLRLCWALLFLYDCIVFVTLCCSSITLRAVGALHFQIPVHDLCILFLTVKLTLTSQSQSRYTTFYFVNVSHSVFHHIPQISSFNVDMISPRCVCVGNMSVSVYSKSSPPSCVVMPAKRGLQLFSRGQDSLWRHQLCCVFVYLQKCVSMPICLWGINVVGGNLQRICGLCELVCKHVCLTASQVAHS